MVLKARKLRYFIKATSLILERTKDANRINHKYLWSIVSSSTEGHGI